MNHRIEAGENPAVSESITMRGRDQDDIACLRLRRDSVCFFQALYDHSSENGLARVVARVVDSQLVLSVSENNNTSTIKADARQTPSEVEWCADELASCVSDRNTGDHNHLTSGVRIKRSIPGMSGKPPNL